MIGTHATGSDSAKWQFFLHDVHDHIVDTNAAGGGACQHRLLFLLVTTKIVGCQRTRMSINVVNGVAKVLVGADRQQGAKQFFFHHLQVIRRIDDQRWRNFTALRLCGEIFTGRINGNRPDTALLSFLQISIEPRIVPVIDNGGVFRIVEHRGIHGTDHFLCGADDRLKMLFRHQQIIRRQTDLTCIQRFSQHDAFKALFNIGSARHNHWRLATQLQRHRHQITRGSSHDVSGH